MPDFKIQRAFISVYDKAGLLDFASELVRRGIEIISTGGTAFFLHDHRLPVTDVERVTGVPEMMEGRVKTLHPHIHGAILANRDNPVHLRELHEQGIGLIDMVVVNLYPFEKTIAQPGCGAEEAIEMIDIGGPCLLRAAAKNHRHVLVVSDPSQYSLVVQQLQTAVTTQLRSDLAGAAFDRTCRYDAAVAAYFLRQRDAVPAGALPPTIQTTWSLGKILRYGENPHQQAGLYFNSDPASARRFEWSAGSEMSFNNCVDAGAAMDLCRELSHARGNAASPCVACFIKHANPSGVGIAAEPVEAYRRAYLGDPRAAMGGILAQNAPVNAETATAVMESLERWGKSAGAEAFFVEAWAAPEFEKAAVDIIRTRKKWGERVRLMPTPDMFDPSVSGDLECKTIRGALLMQTSDTIGLNENQWTVATRRRPSDEEMIDLRLAWLAAKHTRSNAISICKDGMLIGNGAGQMSRVMSCRIAAWSARDNGHTERLVGSAAASDAFFPFRDGPDILLQAGVTALIQPGGSKRDEETITACDEHGAAMIFTGTRHFKHY